MADYRLKLYRRQHPKETPGTLIGNFTLAADSAEEAILRAQADYADYLAECDHAFIGGPHGRIVWELDRP